MEISVHHLLLISLLFAPVKCTDYTMNCQQLKANAENTMTAKVNSENFTKCLFKSVSKVFLRLIRADKSSDICAVSFPECPSSFVAETEPKCLCESSQAQLYHYNFTFYVHSNYTGATLRVDSNCIGDETYNFTFSDCQNLSISTTAENVNNKSTMRLAVWLPMLLTVSLWPAMSY